MTLLILNILLVVAYIAYSVSVTRGIPVSLSATYYTLGKDGWLFQAVMALVGIFLLPVWLEASSDNVQWMAFLSCGGLLFVASAPAFRLELQGMVHYSAAVVCCIGALLWQVFEGLWDVTLWFAWLCGMLTLMWRDKYMWWIECSVIGSLFCNLFRMI